MKKLTVNSVKLLIIPTLIAAGLTACGFGGTNGTRTQSYDGTGVNSQSDSNVLDSETSGIGASNPRFNGWGVSHGSTGIADSLTHINAGFNEGFILPDKYGVNVYHPNGQR